LAAWFVLFTVLRIIASNLHNSRFGNWRSLTAGEAMPGVFLVGFFYFKLVNVRHPRCGKPSFRSAMGSSGLCRGNCVHCGLHLAG
jgi:hypothetical protein